MNVSPGPGGLWPQTAERRPRHSISETHNFAMDQVIKLSRREAKPFMGKPNVIRSHRKPIQQPLYGLLGELLRPPRLGGGHRINSIPMVTPSPKKKGRRRKKTLGQKQRELYSNLTTNKVQQELFNSKQRAINIRQKNRAYRMKMDAQNYNDMHANKKRYDIASRYDAQMTQAIRFHKRYSDYGAKRSRY